MVQLVEPKTSTSTIQLFEWSDRVPSSGDPPHRNSPLPCRKFIFTVNSSLSLLFVIKKNHDENPLDCILWKVKIVKVYPNKMSK
ncbi:hypothetical protein P8452_42569 [Trifolium repens]|nr:hypothetical protein P8452_42569 [Trifolium repens]